MDQATCQLIKTLHDDPARLAFVTTGAGSQAMHWLLQTPGASRTVIEASIPYNRGALIDYLGWEPVQYASRDTAISLAAAAYSRACRFTGERDSILGISCTAAIATDRVKRGAHRAHIAIWDGSTACTYELDMQKGLRDRVGEEHLVSTAILMAIAEHIDIPHQLSFNLTLDDRWTSSQTDVSHQIEQLLHGNVHKTMFYGFDALVPNTSFQGGVLPGSFNPLHEGHLRLAAVASDILDQPVVFEMSVHNVDKPPLTVEEITDRLMQFERIGKRMILTRDALYENKAAQLPGVIFVIGFDTARRTVDPVYYGGSQRAMLASLDRIREYGCSFLVAGRLIEGVFRTLADIAIPAGYDGLFEGIPETQYRVDLSSTALRESSPEQSGSF